MTPEHHDLVLAITSHLPHLIAYNTVATAADLEEVTDSEVIKYSAGGFRDFTRIAASDPTMWRDVFLNNREAVLEMLGRFSEDLSALQRAIRWGDGETLFNLFTPRPRSSPQHYCGRPGNRGSGFRARSQAPLIKRFQIRELEQSPVKCAVPCGEVCLCCFRCGIGTGRLTRFFIAALSSSFSAKMGAINFINPSISLVWLDSLPAKRRWGSRKILPCAVRSTGPWEILSELISRGSPVATAAWLVEERCVGLGDNRCFGDGNGQVGIKNIIVRYWLRDPICR